MKLIRKCLVILIGLLLILPQRRVGAEIQWKSEYPFDETAFTQGLEFYLDELYVGTGLYGQSALGKLQLGKGEITQLAELPAHVFGEGISFTPEYLVQLTWKEGVAYFRNLSTFDIEKQFPYEGEGWGLAYDTDQKALWMSNGTSQLTLRSPQDFKIIEERTVRYQGKEIVNINELEYANGLLYANIWLTDKIIVIDPADGEVLEIFDLGPLLASAYSTEERKTMDTLNGIAHIEDDRFIVTGKFYPTLLEVSLIID